MLISIFSLCMCKLFYYITIANSNIVQDNSNMNFSPGRVRGVYSNKDPTHHFREDWLWEFILAEVQYSKETNCMNCECCSHYRTVENTNFADSAGTKQFKHNILVKYNHSLKHRACHNILINEKATSLSVAFRRQEAANQSKDEAEMMLMFNTAYFTAKEEPPFTKYKSQLNFQSKSGLKLNETYNNDTEWDWESHRNYWGHVSEIQAQW